MAARSRLVPILVALGAALLLAAILMEALTAQADLPPMPGRPW